MSRHRLYFIPANSQIGKETLEETVTEIKQESEIIEGGEIQEMQIVLNCFGLRLQEVCFMFV